MVTITNPETVLLLDKIKGYNGPDSFNTHVRRLAHIYTDLNTVINGWVYVLSKTVVDAYQKIEQIEWGIHDQNDKRQWKLLEKITNPD